MRYKIFISPQVEDCTTNKYMLYFFNALHKKATVVNFGSRKRSRSIDMLLGLFRANVMVLHWAEDIAQLRWGYLQAMLSMLTVFLFRLRGGKVIWFCHNKAPHSKKRYRATLLLRSFYKLCASTIIVHSKDALAEMPTHRPAVYLPHPAYPINIYAHAKAVEGRFQVLIWGSMLPYKGLESFIDSYKLHGQQFTVLMVGSATAEYANLLEQKAAGTNIRIQNEYLDDAALDAYFAGCRFIVLPYLNTDTYCSGALIHSLNAGKIILGPALGNFVDLHEKKACVLYQDYPALFDTINRMIAAPRLYNKCSAILENGVAANRQENSWEDFAVNFMDMINGIRTRHPVTRIAVKLRKNRKRKQCHPAD